MWNSSFGFTSWSKAACDNQLFPSIVDVDGNFFLIGSVWLLSLIIYILDGGMGEDSYLRQP